jgi:hypothetical protein
LRRKSFIFNVFFIPHDRMRALLITHNYHMYSFFRPMSHDHRILRTSLLTVSSIRTAVLTLYLDPLPSFVNGE